MPLEYPIPLTSKNAFEGLSSSAKRNPGLIFERFVPDTQERQAVPGQRNREEPAKKQGLQAVERASKLADADLLKSWHIRWLETIKCNHAEPFKLQTQWRFITGLGRKGALEVGFTFNRYGFPILPGSSVKGLARASALVFLSEILETELKLNALSECLGIEEDEAFETAFKEQFGSADKSLKTAKQIRLTFGTTAYAGKAIFFDAIPSGEKGKLPELELDIMNPHFPRYYEGKDYPTDSQNPIPVYFLTVKKNVTFWFAVGWRGADDPAMRGQVREWLEFGLKELGAGAKTSAGYGYFK